ncbi:MAG: hypothetical protein J4G03_00480 [Gemmatimonadetes bacterium]|nr:hypothetical protein [Gemmatimonadota bacterium]
MNADQTGAAGLREVLYEPDDIPPTPVAAGIALQFVGLCIGGIVLGVAIILDAGGQTGDYRAWAVFAALVVSGISTIVQSQRFGQFGAGHVLLMGTSGAFIAASVQALTAGGPALLATLVVISALFQFGLATRLSTLRSVITPTVSGIVIMLISVTVLPIGFDMLSSPVEGTPGWGVPVTGIVTLVVTVAAGLLATGRWRLWSPVLGMLAGSAVGATAGIYDTGLIASADWVGLPPLAWPGLDLGFGPEFWFLLPMFVLVTLVGAVETVGDSVVIQQVSRKKAGPTDYRVVQGAVAADGLGNLLSGLAATAPNTTYSSSPALVELTGVGARRVGVWIGGVLIGLSLFPKFAAVILAMPGAVVGAYLIVLMALLFVLGIRIALSDGVTSQKALLIGIAFWLGSGFQNGQIFADLIPASLQGLLGNGMTSGGLAAVAMTLFIQVFRPRARVLRTRLNAAAVTEIEQFLRAFAVKRQWSADGANRLCAAAEETVLSLVTADAPGGSLEREGTEAERDLRLQVRGGGNRAVLEFAATSDSNNLEERLAINDLQGGARISADSISIRLLGHYASSVRHQKYFDTDIVTVIVDGDKASGRVAA